MTEVEIKSVLRENEELKKQVSDKDALIAKLQDELAGLRKKVFGHTSEKRLPLDPNQLCLFDLREMTEDEKAQLDVSLR